MRSRRPAKCGRRPLKLIVRCMSRFLSTLVSFFVALSFAPQLFSADPSKSAPSTLAEPRMASADVLDAAKKLALARGVQLQYYSVRSPIYRPRTKDWDVVFVDSRFIPDSNFSIIISDTTGKGCLMTGLSPSCT